MRLRSDGPLKGCDQPESHLNRKERATATGPLQTWYQLPVQGCMRQAKNRNQRKKKVGGKLFFHCEKGQSRGSHEPLSKQRKERLEGPVSLPTKQHF